MVHFSISLVANNYIIITCNTEAQSGVAPLQHNFAIEKFIFRGSSSLDSRRGCWWRSLYENPFMGVVNSSLAWNFVFIYVAYKLKELRTATGAKLFLSRAIAVAVVSTMSMADFAAGVSSCRRTGLFWKKQKEKKNVVVLPSCLHLSTYLALSLLGLGWLQLRSPI